MKKITPFIIILAFTVTCCKKEPDTPDPIYDSLDFRKLVSIMGASMDLAKETIPGAFQETIIDNEWIGWRYVLLPENLDIVDTLDISYYFNDDSLKQVQFRATRGDNNISDYSENSLDLALQMINLAADQVGEGEYAFVSLEYSESFTSAKELLDFIESIDIMQNHIRSITGRWMIDNYNIYISFAPYAGPFKAWIS